MTGRALPCPGPPSTRARGRPARDLAAGDLAAGDLGGPDVLRRRSAAPGGRGSRCCPGGGFAPPGRTPSAAVGGAELRGHRAGAAKVEKLRGGLCPALARPVHARGGAPPVILPPVILPPVILVARTCSA